MPETRRKKWSRQEYSDWCRKLGRRNVRSGRLKLLQKIAAPLGGLAQGKANAESGHMQAIQKIGAAIGGIANGFLPENLRRLDAVRTPEACRRGGQVACHLRYHQEKFNPRCEICQEEKAGEYPPEKKTRTR
jgi:hypothetical protein